MGKSIKKLKLIDINWEVRETVMYDWCIGKNDGKGPFLQAYRSFWCLFHSYWSCFTIPFTIPTSLPQPPGLSVSPHCMLVHTRWDRLASGLFILFYVHREIIHVHYRWWSEWDDSPSVFTVWFFIMQSSHCLWNIAALGLLPYSTIWCIGFPMV